MIERTELEKKARRYNRRTFARMPDEEYPTVTDILIERVYVDAYAAGYKAGQKAIQDRVVAAEVAARKERERRVQR